MKATSPIARAALPFVGALIFVLAWELVVQIGHVRPVFFPAPSLIISEISKEPIWFAEQTAYTIGITLLGFALAAVAGILFAIVIVEWSLLDRMLFPLFIALNSIPKVAIAPLFIIWFGTGAT